MDKYIKEIITEANKAIKQKEVPIGAIIVYKGKIIARAHNNRIKNNDVTDHAEIKVIRKASKKLKDWRLNECDLYVTLKPCRMCEEVIKESRIKNVYYLLDRLEEKKQYTKTNICSINNSYKEETEEYKKIIQKFFQLNCKR